MAQRKIPPERQGLYYIGVAISVIGFLTFGSVLVEGMSRFGNFDHFEQRTRSMGTRALVGMAMTLVGGIMSGIGRRGLAGSGIVLDPEAARQDAEPWSRMTGGMVKDAMDEAGVNLGALSSNADLPFDERLRRLQKLREDGLVSEEEFETTKKKILESA